MSSSSQIASITPNTNSSHTEDIVPNISSLPTYYLEVTSHKPLPVHTSNPSQTASVSSSDNIHSAIAALPSITTECSFPTCPLVVDLTSSQFSDGSACLSPKKSQFSDGYDGFLAHSSDSNPHKSVVINTHSMVTRAKSAAHMCQSNDDHDDVHIACLITGHEIIEPEPSLVVEALNSRNERQPCNVSLMLLLRTTHGLLFHSLQI